MASGECMTDQDADGYDELLMLSYSDSETAWYTGALWVVPGQSEWNGLPGHQAPPLLHAHKAQHTTLTDCVQIGRSRR